MPARELSSLLVVTTGTMRSGLANAAFNRESQWSARDLSTQKTNLKGLATPEESNPRMTEEPIRPTPISCQKAPR